MNVRNACLLLYNRSNINRFFDNAAVEGHGKFQSDTNVLVSNVIISSWLALGETLLAIKTGPDLVENYIGVF